MKVYESVYSGVRGACCCGCSGRYWQDGEKMFPSMLKKVLNNPLVKDEGSHAWVEVGAKIYVAYKYK